MARDIGNVLVTRLARFCPEKFLNTGEPSIPYCTRLIKLEKTGEGTQTKTLYVGPLEIRKPGTPDVQLLAYPHPAIRLTDGVPATLHKDQLNSVRGLFAARAQSWGQGGSPA